MRDIYEIYGKRIKAAVPLKMDIGSPGNQDKKTLSAGKPSPLIDGYVKGYFNVVDKEAQKSYWIKDRDSLEIVSADAADDSSWADNVLNGISDSITETENDVSNWKGYLGKGFNQTIKDAQKYSSVIGSDIRKILIAGIAALFLIIILKIWNL